jgi:hypothetical protein
MEINVRARTKNGQIINYSTIFHPPTKKEKAFLFTCCSVVKVARFGRRPMAALDRIGVAGLALGPAGRLTARLDPHLVLAHFTRHSLSEMNAKFVEFSQQLLC